MKGKTSNTFMFILLGLLILGLAGFGIGSFSGSMRAIGSVGQTDITVDEYGRALQQELRAAGAQTGTAVNMAEARQLGLDRVVLARLVAAAALDEEARRLGVSVGDEIVRDQVISQPAFQGLDGGFDRDAYEFTLQQNGLSAAQFEETVRAETTRTLLQGAILGGVSVPARHTDTLLDFIGEQRSFRWAPVTPALVEISVPEPDDAALRAHYESDPGAYTVPETRVITYALLTPEMMLEAIEVPEDEIRALYDNRINEFVQPERRLVERLVFGNTEEARVAKEAFDSGSVTFEALVSARGLRMQDVDLGDVRPEDLTNAAAEAVFGLAEPGVTGPVNSALGPALFRVNGILAAQETTFEEVRDDLRSELAADGARRAVAAEIEALDDLLAGGATLEDLGVETAMETGVLRLRPDSTEGPAAYPEIRAAADLLRDGDFPQIETLEDGGIFALRLDEILPPALQPLEDVRAEVEADWRAAETVKALTAAADEIAASLRSGTPVEETGLIFTEETDLTREAFLEAAPDGLVATAFGLPEGGTAVLPGPEAAYVVQLISIAPPDPADPDAEFLRGVLSENLSQALSQDMFAAFATALQAEAGLTIDQSAINAVQSQFP